MWPIGVVRPLMSQGPSNGRYPFARGVTGEIRDDYHSHLGELWGDFR